MSTTTGTSVPSDRFSTGMNLSFSCPIRIPSLDDLTAIADAMRAEVVEVRNAGLPWNGDTPTLVVFKPHFSNTPLVLQVGQCTQREEPMLFYPLAAKSQRKLWANFVIIPDSDFPDIVGPHDCSTDHIETWTDWKKDFFICLPLTQPQVLEIPLSSYLRSYGGDTLMMHFALGVTPWLANPNSLVLSFCTKPVFHHPRCSSLATLKKSSMEGAASRTTTRECRSLETLLVSLRLHRRMLHLD